MSTQDIDAYISALTEPKRSTLEKLRKTIMGIIPDAQQGLSYGMPAFRLNGKVVAGFAAFKNHLSYLPHSGSVLDELADQISGYSSTKGSLHFAVDTPLAAPLVEKLIAAKQRQITGQQG